MNEAKFKVLLYLNESQFSIWGVIYSAILMLNIPNMHLTVVKLKESDIGSMESENNWLNSGPIYQNLEWMQDVMDIFKIRAVDVHHQVIYCNPNIPDTVEALLEYVRKKSIELIVMGTGELRTIKGLIFGSLVSSLQDRSPIPVLMVKSLPQGLLDIYSSKSRLKIVQK